MRREDTAQASWVSGVFTTKSCKQRFIRLLARNNVGAARQNFMRFDTGECH
jgi:hypothetical protein